MATFTGRRRPLTLPRKWIADLMYFARGMPTITAQRTMNLGALSAARGDLPWAVPFVKAFALVAAKRPELRRSYQPFPWPHLYETDQSVASLAVAREYEGESAVFFGLLHAPDQQTLRELAKHVHDFKTLPVERVRPFSRLIRYTRYPRPIRRFIWWIGLNLSGRSRAKTVGTFGLSTVAGAGAELLNLISPVAISLNYGPVAEDGRVDVRLNFDHRVIDGLSAANALKEMEAVLGGELVRELQEAA